MINLVIMGAGGRDFHDFNVLFRDDPESRVVAFTAAQIPGIDDRRYPARRWPGPLYPDGIPIVPEAELGRADRASYDVDEVVLAYSDLSHDEVMHKASPRARRRGRLPAARPARDDARVARSRSSPSAPSAPAAGKSQTSRRIGRAPARRRAPRRARPPSDALRRPRGDARPAVREPRRHRRQRTRRSRSARSTKRPVEAGHDASTPASTTRRSSPRPSRRRT